MKTLSAFVAIGALGFCIDAGILTTLVNGGAVNPYLARLVSFPLAVFATWALNRRFAFSSAAKSSKDRAAEYGRYLGVQVVGAVANLFVYGICLYFWAELEAWPVVPLAVGAVAGLLINFSGSRLWVFAEAGKSTK